MEDAEQTTYVVMTASTASGQGYQPYTAVAGRFDDYQEAKNFAREEQERARGWNRYWVE